MTLNKRQLAALEQELVADERGERDRAEREEFDHLQMKYMHIDEYELLERAIEDVLDLLDEKPEYKRDLHAPILGSEPAAEAWDRFVEKARELEREEQYSGKTQNQDETAGR